MLLIGAPRLSRYRYRRYPTNSRESCYWKPGLEVDVVEARIPGLKHPFCLPCHRQFGAAQKATSTSESSPDENHLSSNTMPLTVFFTPPLSGVGEDHNPMVENNPNRLFIAPQRSMRAHASENSAVQSSARIQ
tara:strand:+ start:94 stop:492 length:399 start_codon:yes stop_codon:yes gene_type:complete